VGTRHERISRNARERNLETSPLEVIERCDEFGFLETVGHKEKNLHIEPLFEENNKIKDYSS
jgi:hypothetical protein